MIFASFSTGLVPQIFLRKSELLNVAKICIKMKMRMMMVVVTMATIIIIIIIIIMYDGGGDDDGVDGGDGSCANCFVDVA